MDKNTFFRSLQKDFRRDWNTVKKLEGKKKLEFFWDYYKWPVIIFLSTVIIVTMFIHMLWEGQKPCRLRVCVVLNTDDDCDTWFRHFTEELQSDKKPGSVDINLDQPFDYNNRYYQIQEIEVQATISSKRMDVAVCGKDMYHYLLKLNACLPLDQSLSKDFISFLSDKDRLIYDTANLAEDENGYVNPEDGIPGYYAVDLSGTEFCTLYNSTAAPSEPLYAVIISNTEHLDDSEALLKALVQYY